MFEKILTTLTPEEAELLNSLAVTESYPRGAVIIEQFSIPKGISIITEGKVRLFELTVLAKSLCALQLADLSASDEAVLLGESSLLLGQLNSCTVVAATEIKHLLLPLEEYEKIKQEHPTLALKIMEYMSKTLAFRYLNMQEKFENRIIGGATNPHSALAVLKKYVGNVRVCTPAMAQKLFNIDTPIL